MTLQTLQCPKCGAHLDAAGRDDLFCSYCGAHLKVRTGASGNPMATLDGIKEDTTVLAREATYARLVKDVAALLERQQELKAKRKATKEDGQNGGGCAMLIALACGLGGAGALIAGGRSWFMDGSVNVPSIALGILGLALCAFVGWASSREQRQVEAKRNEALAQIDAERAKVDEALNRASAQMQELRAQMDKQG